MLDCVFVFICYFGCLWGVFNDELFCICVFECGCEVSVILRFVLDVRVFFVVVFCLYYVV